MTQRRRSAGFSLVEVLVAVLLLSIGLLGLAAMQVSSARHNHSAYLRSQATLLGYDILDRMRANRVAALAGAYQLALEAPAPNGSSRADSDLREWRQALAATLPLVGEGGAVTLAPDGVVTVTIEWRDAHWASGAAQSLAFSVSTRL